MAKLDDLLEELVTGNRILAREGVVDSFGHISVRHPDNPQRYLLSRARAPDCIEKDDIMEFTLDGDAGRCRRPRALSRTIHPRRALRGAAGCDVGGAQPQRKRHPVRSDRQEDQADLPHGRIIGHEVPVWDSHDNFGDTALLVENMEMGRDLAKLMGASGTVLMRGHGATVAGRNIRHAVYISVYLEVNARLQKQAMDMGDVKFLTAGEVDKVASRTGSYGINRAWENWCRRANRPLQAEPG